MDKAEREKWYNISIEGVFAKFDTRSSGLTQIEAKHRIEKYGYNEIEYKRKRGPLYQFFKQFFNPLIYVLILAALLTIFVKHWIDTALILAIVFANAIIGFIQERKAEHALESLAKMIVSYTTVIRDHQRITIPTREVVPGDIVTLNAGDKVSADIRMISTKMLTINEALLTGESHPVEKLIEPISKENIPLGDQRNMAFSGTLVSSGHGRGVVIATGRSTEIGRISEFIRESKPIQSPLVSKIADFSKIITIAILCISVSIFAIGIIRGYDIVFMFLATISIAVAAIPEGLPAMVTIMLALSVKKMASKHSIIRSLPAVETLGSTTVICSDKTGTLTKNQMTVTKIFASNKMYDVTGTGYAPEGAFLFEEKNTRPEEDKSLSETLITGYLCNNASLEKEDEEYAINGDPTEGALLVSALKAGLKPVRPIIDEIPFDAQHLYMAALVEDTDGHIIYVKGAPEKILSLCSAQLVNGEEMEIKKELIMKKSSEMASGALRVLAMARKHIPREKVSIDPGDIDDLVFLGLQGMMDPPRKEAIDAVAKCKKSGIRVVMITGDHRNTAQAIAKHLGLENEMVITGEELEKMSDDDLYKIVRNCSVFARTSPEHKLRVVKQLQRWGETVAVTGDGVNDAPALKTADIGIAMGITGTEVSKEAAHMIITDDNFSSIVSAVEEGRNVYNNVQKTILWTLPTNGGEALIIIIAIILSTSLPLLPVQILWINMITALLLGLTLAAEPLEKDVLKKPPRPRIEPILTGLIKQRIILVSLLMSVCSFLLYVAHIQQGFDIAVARTITLNTIIFFEIFYLFNSRKVEDFAYKAGFFTNKLLLIGVALQIAAQLVVTYAPFMNSLLYTAPIPITSWLMIVGVSSSVFFIVEGEKFLRKKIASYR